MKTIIMNTITMNLKTITIIMTYNSNNKLSITITMDTIPLTMT